MPVAASKDSQRVVKRFLPFGEGPRSCAGMNLAKINMTATLASLLGNFSFKLADEVWMQKHPLVATQPLESCVLRGNIDIHTNH
jgi:cytochrome P450